MPERTVQLVLQYDGGGFAGWQRQPQQRTVQGVVEDAISRLCDEPIPVLGAGRTDAGVHARGQAAGVRVSGRWTAPALERALNALLPDDVWVRRAHEMHPAFHARFGATARRYSYYLGTDPATRSPFRRRWEWAIARPLDRAALAACARLIEGEHVFRAFAVRGTAPPTDSHRCHVSRAQWIDRPRGRGIVLRIEANRFLHHMVRLLVGTMVEIALGRRPLESMAELLAAADNASTAPPAPPHALFLDAVHYPRHLYLEL